jgi:hypothetical protein
MTDNVAGLTKAGPDIVLTRAGLVPPAVGKLLWEKIDTPDALGLKNSTNPPELNTAPDSLEGLRYAGEDVQPADCALIHGDTWQKVERNRVTGVGQHDTLRIVGSAHQDFGSGEGDVFTANYHGQKKITNYRTVEETSFGHYDETFHEHHEIDEKETPRFEEKKIEFVHAGTTFDMVHFEFKLVTFLTFEARTGTAAEYTNLNMELKLLSAEFAEMEGKGILKVADFIAGKAEVKAAEVEAGGAKCKNIAQTNAVCSVHL